jgi:hypothetical protein
MRKDTIIEIGVFIAATWGSNYLFDTGLWSLLIGIIAGGLYKTVFPSNPPKND